MLFNFHFFSTHSVAYPAFVSLKALETSTKDDDTKWLTYWVLYAIFSVLEFFTGFLYAIIPFYFLLKVKSHDILQSIRDFFN